VAAHLAKTLKHLLSYVRYLAPSYTNLPLAVETPKGKEIWPILLATQSGKTIAAAERRRYSNPLAGAN
ncbi:MAG TPA: hypothetical protein VIX42_09930, partial [Edaphobacter sp.]